MRRRGPRRRDGTSSRRKGFCLTYLPHHFSADLTDFFDEMADDGNYLAHSGRPVGYVEWVYGNGEAAPPDNPPASIEDDIDAMEHCSTCGLLVTDAEHGELCGSCGGYRLPETE